MNAFASWCAACRYGHPLFMRLNPERAGLQAKLGGPEFEVVALLIDRGGLVAVGRFFDEIGIERLRIYLDPPNASTRALGVGGLPTTLLIDREGREIGRVVGPAEWDSSEIVTLIRQHIDQSTAGGARRSAVPHAREGT